MEYTAHSQTRTRVVRRSNYIKGVLRTVSQDHFDLDNVSGYEGKLIRVNKDRVYKIENGEASYVSSLPTMVKGKSLGWNDVIEVGDKGLKGLVNKIISKSPETKALNSSAVPESIKSKADTVKQGVVNESPKGLLQGLALGATVAGAGLLSTLGSSKGSPTVTTSNANPDAPVGSVVGSGPAVSSAIAGGEPVKADIITTTVKTVDNTVNKVDKVVPVDKVISLGKALLGTKSTGTNPKPAANVALKSEPVQTNVVQASTPVSMNMTVIYIAIGAVVLVVLFSNFKS